MTKFVLSKVEMISCGRECLSSSALKSKSVLFRGGKQPKFHSVVSYTKNVSLIGEQMKYSKGQIRSF